LTVIYCRVLAQNENGEDAASILVTVTAPPSPAGKPVVIDITGTTCTIRYNYKLLKIYVER
jgi:hypothetical protein